MVTTDNLKGGCDATNHLIELGHRRIAVITGRLDLSVGFERAEGFRKAMQQANLLIRDEYFRRGDFLLESGYRCGKELLEIAEPPTAVVSCNNIMTLGLLRAVSELRVRIPDQLSVVSFGDFVWSETFSPKLTAVSVPSYELGRRGMEMLIREMRAPESASERKAEDTLVVLKGELLVRESTAPPCSSPSEPAEHTKIRTPVLLEAGAKNSTA
jgi:DNA-binding LacI/PurR family transcriptional regulator